jgi:hypothetical protein
MLRATPTDPPNEIESVKIKIRARDSDPTDSVSGPGDARNTVRYTGPLARCLWRAAAARHLALPRAVRPRLLPALPPSVPRIVVARLRRPPHARRRAATFGPRPPQMPPPGSIAAGGSC